MKMPNALPLTTTAILAMAEIKAATDAFDRGDSNVIDALKAVVVAVEAFRARASDNVSCRRQEREAA